MSDKIMLSFFYISVTGGFPSSEEVIHSHVKWVSVLGNSVDLGKVTLRTRVLAEEEVVPSH